MGFRALMLEADGDKIQPAFREIEISDLPDDDVLIEISHSSLNYKDGLALTGQAKIARRYPMIAGIDFAGTVIESRVPEWKPGDGVLSTGWGLSETTHGGYSRYARVGAGTLTRIPAGLSAAEAMAIGTAGFTAMLSVMALEDHARAAGSDAEKHVPATETKADAGLWAGPVLVTGASGGVGSIAVALLSALGHEVVASTGRLEERTYLESLGAKRLVPREHLTRPSRALESETWAGAVDNVGGEVLTTVLAQMRRGAAVSSCGNARSAELKTTVFPFILRGVALLGIDSNFCPPPRRDRAWARLAKELDRALLQSVTRTVKLSDLPSVSAEIVEGRVRGRTVVEID